MNDNSLKSKEALSEFWTECDEIIERVSAQLASFERGEFSQELIDSMYRDVHTMKGTAQLFGFSEISKILHLIETSLEPVRDGRKKISPTMIELLYKGIKVIEGLLAKLQLSGEKSSQDMSESGLHIISEEIHIPSESPAFDEKVNETTTVADEFILQKLAPIITVENTQEKSMENPVKNLSMATEKPEKHEKEESSTSDSSSTIRVPVPLLDKLMTLMGEMVLVRNQVLQYSSRSDDLEFLNLSQRLDVVTSELQGEMMKTRMQPIGNILTKFQRLVRDLSKDLGKKIDLVLSGTETELDKTLLEAVKDPLTHIIRNACDHGV